MLNTRLELVNLITINEDDNFRNEIIAFFIPKFKKEELCNECKKKSDFCGGETK